jgi:hypothetical protein
VGTSGPPALSPEGSGTIVGVKVANAVHWYVSQAKSESDRKRWAFIIAPCPPAIVWGATLNSPEISHVPDWRVPSKALQAPYGIDEVAWKRALVDRVLPEGLKFRPVSDTLLHQLPANYELAIVETAKEFKGFVTDGLVIEAMSLALSIASVLSKVPAHSQGSESQKSSETFGGTHWLWQLDIAETGYFGWGIQWGGQQWAVPGSVAGSSVEFMCAVAPPQDLAELCLELTRRLEAAVAACRSRFREKELVARVAEIGRSQLWNLQHSHEIYDGDANSAKGAAIVDAAVRLTLEAIRPGKVAEVIVQGQARALAGRMNRETAEMWAAKVNRKVTLVEDSRGMRQRVEAVGVEERTGQDGAAEFGVRLTDGEVMWDRAFFENATRGGCLGVIIFMILPVLTLVTQVIHG